MNIINPQMEEYTVQLDGGEIEIGGTKYLYDSMKITSKLLKEGYFKEQEIILDIHNIPISYEAIKQIRHNNDNMKGTEIIFEIRGNRFRHFGILEEYTVIRDESRYMDVRMDTDVKINIGLAGSCINKGLHKLVIVLSQWKLGEIVPCGEDT